MDGGLSHAADLSGLTEIYQQTAGELYRYVSHKAGGDRELSEDIVQETYLRAVGDWHARGFPDEPIAWLKTTARHLLVDHFRRSRERAIEDLDGFAAQAPSHERRTMLERALAKLTRGHARLLEAFHLEGRRVREIAAESGLSERAVEGRLRRARHALRLRLSPPNEQGD